MTLIHYFINAPLSAIITILLGCSMAVTFDAVGERLFKRTVLWIRACYFFTGLTILSLFIFLTAIAGIISVTLLVFVAATFILSGIYHFINRFSQYRAIFKRHTLLPGYPLPTRLLWWILTGCCLLMAVATPSDADSLEYHLALPVQVLNTGSLHLNPDLLHFRLFGGGEMINTLGVATGALQLGSFLQFIAIYWLLVIVKSFAAHRSAFLVLGVPVMLFLVPGQKFQLTGVIATTICFYAITYLRQEKQFSVLLLWAATLCFAISLKYSFMFSGLAMLCALAVTKHNLQLCKKLIAPVSLCAMVIILPFIIFKQFRYGDPFSPLLEQWKEQPDSIVTAFSRYLGNYKESTLPFPLDVFVPDTLGHISATMGWSAVILLAFLCWFRHFRSELLAVVVLILLTCLLGQRTARFFLEPYLWLLPLIVQLANGRSWMAHLITGAKVQAWLLVPFFAYGAFISLQSIVSDNTRETFLQQQANGYAECRWMNDVIPPGSKIATDIRARAFLPGNAFSREYFNAILQKDSTISNNIVQRLKREGIEYLVVEKAKYKRLSAKLDLTLVAESPAFKRGTRNPFNAKAHQMVILKLNN